MTDLRIMNRDEFTGEVQDQYGNWHDSDSALYDMSMTLGEQKFEEQRDNLSLCDELKSFKEDF